MIYLKEYYNYDNKVEKICCQYEIENWSIRNGLVDVDGNVYLYQRRLTKLPLKFGRVSGDFDCTGNKLTSLKGSPEEVGGYFDCDDNNLTSLEGGPKEVGGYFSCEYNQIETLEYFPKVGSDIFIYNNPLPMEIQRLTDDQIKKVIKEQDFYEIWRDGELFQPRWRELKIDLGL